MSRITAAIPQMTTTVSHDARSSDTLYMLAE
jgi:hypothetical protein